MKVHKCEDRVRRYEKAIGRERKVASMWFWIFMFVCNNLIPLTMWGIGIWFEKKPPTGINAVFGYRTKRSMRSQEAWDFAQRYMGHMWKKAGAVLIIVSVMVSTAMYGMSEDGIGYASVILIHIQLAILLISIYPVEKALKKNFE